MSLNLIFSKLLIFYQVPYKSAWTKKTNLTQGISISTEYYSEKEKRKSLEQLSGQGLPSTRVPCKNKEEKMGSEINTWGGSKTAQQWKRLHTNLTATVQFPESTVERN